MQTADRWKSLAMPAHGVTAALAEQRAVARIMIFVHGARHTLSLRFIERGAILLYRTW